MTLWRTTVLDLASDADGVRRELERASPASGVVEAWVRPTMPGVVRGGDLIWRLGFEDEDALGRWLGSDGHTDAAAILAGPSVSRYTSATYRGGRTGARSIEGTRAVHRTLLLRAVAPEETIARFEAELFAMGEHIPVMRWWRLARVLKSAGSVPWTHVWEQEFPEPDALYFDYMRHPYHWGHVDRWFDGESPEKIVTTDFCHTFCLLGE